MADRFDVVVYGGTPAGLMAAIAAARLGASVVLMEQTGHVGGLSTSGLVTAEAEHMRLESFSGLPLEFYRRLGTAYGKPAPLFHWAELASGNTDDIVNNGLGGGVQTVEIDSPFFETNDCGNGRRSVEPRPRQGCLAAAVF